MSPGPAQQHRRYSLALDVDVRFNRDDVRLLKTDNLSLGGAFINSSSLVAVGTPLLLRVHTAPAAYAVNARVVHALDEAAAAARARLPGLGVEFVDLSPGLESVLTDLFRAQARDAWKQRARNGLDVARKALRQTVALVRENLRPAELDATTDAVPWYKQVKTPEPTGAAADQLRDLIALAHEHEDSGDLEDARVTWLMANELIKKHPELSVLLGELPTAERDSEEPAR